MRVLMLSWEYPPNVVGGLGKHVSELIPALARRGIEVHLVTPQQGVDQTRDVLDHVTIHKIGVASPFTGFPDFYTEATCANAALQHACEQIVNADGPFDLIHNHDWLTSFAATALKHQFKLPMIATIHATERGRGRGTLQGEQAHRINAAEWRLSFEAWRVICCAQYMARELQLYFNTPADKVDVIPNGIDPSPFRALDGLDLAAFRAHYALPEEKIVLYVGRVVAEKGVEVLVRAVPNVIAALPHAKFIIAGKGPELEHLRRLAAELQLGDSVRFVGFISDPERDQLYKVADCAVFPSLYEPFGIVALEAMAACTPVVVSEVGGLREVVRHAETGITIYPNNPESCAWGIIHTLQHPEWARQRVENAYREVLTIYNWDTVAGQTAEVYARVVAERARTAWR
jgi:glycogen synthase